jgi:hypothetical protein
MFFRTFFYCAFDFIDLSDFCSKNCEEKFELHVEHECNYQALKI